MTLNLYFQRRFFDVHHVTSNEIRENIGFVLFEIKVVQRSIIVVWPLFEIKGAQGSKVKARNVQWSS